VAIVGARGAVGSTVLRVLEERNLEIGGLRITDLQVFSSPQSEGKIVPFAGEELQCKVLSDRAVEGFDLAIGAAGSGVTREWADKFVQAESVFIDKSSELRRSPKVPLVVPEVNPEALEDHEGKVASPNCSTIQLVVAINPIFNAVGIERLVVSTYQSVSGTGMLAEDELRQQSRAVLAGETVEPSVYPHQIAFNVLPQVEVFGGQLDGEEGYTTEEEKIAIETRRILGGDTTASFGISATCARVPVINSHSESINVQTKDDLSPAECRALLADAPGVRVVDEPEAGSYPMAIAAAGQDDVLVGRIRRDPSHPRCLNLWVVGDNLRKGAATNAVQIAEEIVDRDLLY
jgi:aspartate-semialdehyde dehydrogenase